jgi:pyruvate,orthophosphate dikinase
MKHVFFFGAKQTEGKKEMKELLGGKGANLAEMSTIGLPVPPGFTISTETCADYHLNHKIPEATMQEIETHLTQLEKVTGKQLGNRQNPLLLSVRSGAAASMPGMMDTVLNLGLNDTIVQGLAKQTKNERFAWDSYRRFIQMFGNVIMDVPHHDFEHELEKIKTTQKLHYDTELSISDLKEIVKAYKEVIKTKTKSSFPEEGKKQLMMSIEAVFRSWNNERANTYRRLNDIKGLKGTAVNVQSMVFGNKGETSGTGVCFTRNPATGEKKFYGEYLMNAQGEDVVAGIRTPKPISTLKQLMPEIYKELEGYYQKLEKHYKDMQDMEFTIEEGKLYILQTRNGKRTAHAAVKIAVDMVEEGLIDKKTALLRIDPASLDQLLHKTIDPKAKTTNKVIAKGLPASPGAAVGKIVFDAQQAVVSKERGEKVILVRHETSPEDLIGMDAAVGILTARGGMTSHAAVVARGMGKCCISGCSEAHIEEKTQSLHIGDQHFKAGDYLTLDGSEGLVYAGTLPLIDPTMTGAFGKIMTWADEYRRLKVRTNADTPKDATVALEFGAEGIGLCRTEHMFFAGERIKAMREMILAEDTAGRKKALAKIIPYQQADFKELFTIMNRKSVTIRLLDPPLHEFLPQEKKDKEELAKEMHISLASLEKKIIDLHEVNPMLGHRGCRLGISYPEITEMQATAIFTAALEAQHAGIQVKPEIMIPLVGNIEEFKHQKKIIQDVAERLQVQQKISYLIGTMIEVPRAALTADSIAKEAEFFSFGTNDLTQMTLGFSRDDVGKFVPEFIKKGILEKDPFQVLDQTGVGQLVTMGVQKGRSSRSTLKVGICGEHGGEPNSIIFCHTQGLDYVSCSPYRVPIARLAAAHAALKTP